MILNVQHSVNCFHYAPMGMHSKINSVPFLLIHIVLFVRIMHDYAEIYKLCNRMWFLINYAGSHHRTLSEALTMALIRFHTTTKQVTPRVGNWTFGNWTHSNIIEIEPKQNRTQTFSEYYCRTYSNLILQFCSILTMYSICLFLITTTSSKIKLVMFLRPIWISVNTVYIFTRSDLFKAQPVRMK